MIFKLNTNVPIYPDPIATPSAIGTSSNRLSDKILADSVFNNVLKLH